MVFINCLISLKVSNLLYMVDLTAEQVENKHTPSDLLQEDFEGVVGGGAEHRARGGGGG